jgi:hypothetical protein
MAFEKKCRFYVFLLCDRIKIFPLHSPNEKGEFVLFIKRLAMSSEGFGAGQHRS